MKFALLNRSYIILAGVVVVMIALVSYMWMDTRKLDRSLSQKTKPALATKQSPGVSEPTITQIKGTESEPVERRPLSQPDRPKSERTTIVDKVPSRRENVPVTGPTDDWMYEKGENIESEELVVSEAKHTTE